MVVVEEEHLISESVGPICLTELSPQVAEAVLRVTPAVSMDKVA